MHRQPWRRAVRGLAAVALGGGLLMFGGCGGPDLELSGTLAPTPIVTATVPPTCLPAGDACTMDSDCCSGSCITPDGVNFECQ
jgi:hypothetical protein